MIEDEKIIEMFFSRSEKAIQALDSKYGKLCHSLSLARTIEAFLDTLTVENRVIFMRRYWFADSCKEIAERVGLTEKNISVRLTRIRKKMKGYLTEREVFV